MLDYYQILGVSESANDAEIKLAFKVKARELHPDKHKGDSEMEERFKELNLAYQTLKNPYERARYDLKRKFGDSHPQQYAESSYPPPPTTFYRKNYKVNYRENWIATAYAFGFSFIVAILVMIAIQVKRNYDQERYAEILEKRRATFTSAVEKHQNGQMRDALMIMNSLGGFFSEESELEEFRKGLVDEAYDKGNSLFYNEQYEEAIYYFEIIDDLTRIPPLSIKENLAISYRNIGQSDKSIIVLRELLNLGYRNLFIYTELARIYRDIDSDIENSILYFENAQDLMVEYYESMYGRSYTITMSGRSVPQYHRQIYYELLDLYYKTDNRQQILATAVWIKRLWPDNYEAIITVANAYLYCGKNQKSCDEFEIARSLNPNLIVPSPCASTY